MYSAMQIPIQCSEETMHWEKNEEETKFVTKRMEEIKENHQELLSRGVDCAHWKLLFQYT